MTDFGFSRLAPAAPVPVAASTSFRFDTATGTLSESSTPTRVNANHLAEAPIPVTASTSFRFDTATGTLSESSTPTRVDANHLAEAPVPVTAYQRLHSILSHILDDIQYSAPEFCVAYSVDTLISLTKTSMSPGLWSLLDQPQATCKRDLHDLLSACFPLQRGHDENVGVYLVAVFCRAELDSTQHDVYKSIQHDACGRFLDSPHLVFSHEELSDRDTAADFGDANYAYSGSVSRSCDESCVNFTGQVSPGFMARFFTRDTLGRMSSHSRAHYAYVPESQHSIIRHRRSQLSQLIHSPRFISIPAVMVDLPRTDFSSMAHGAQLMRVMESMSHGLFGLVHPDGHPGCTKLMKYCHLLTTSTLRDHPTQCSTMTTLWDHPIRWSSIDFRGLPQKAAHHELRDPLTYFNQLHGAFRSGARLKLFVQNRCLKVDLIPSVHDERPSWNLAFEGYEDELK